MRPDVAGGDSGKSNNDLFFLFFFTVEHKGK